MSDPAAVDWRQFRTLIRVFLKMNARGKSGRRPYGRALSLLVSYGISSSYLGWTLGSAFFEPAYVLVSAVVTMNLAGFTVLSSYPLILMDPQEDHVLSIFPVSMKTLFLARITNMVLYVVLITIPFGLPLAGFYWYYTAAAETVLSFVATLFLCTLWTTGLFIIIYNFAIARFGKSTQLLAVAQIVLVFCLLFFYQALPSVTENSIDWGFLLSSTTSLVFPPLWFVSLHGELTGVDFQAFQSVYALLAVATTAFLLLFLRSRWLLLPERLEVRETPRRGWTHARPVIDSFLRMFAPRHPERRAGYDLFLGAFSRERALRLQILPIVMMPAAVAMYGLLAGELASPFRFGLLGYASKIHIPVLVFSLFSARHVAKVSERVLQGNTVWIFRQHGAGTLERYARGVRLSIARRILLPQAGVLFLFFLFSMPPFEALLHAAFILVFCRFQSAVLALLRPRIPFSSDEERLATAQRFAQIFIILPFFALAFIAHAPFARSYASFTILLAMVELGTQICMRIPRTGAHAFRTT